MERFSVINPAAHFSLFSLSPADREALAETSTPSTRPDFDRPKSAFDGTALPSYYGKHDSSVATHQMAEKESPPVTFKPGTRFYLAFSALASLSLVVALDGTSISVALPVMAKQLNGSAMDAFWAGTSFLLTSTIFQPIYAAFSHIFGRKEITLVAVFFFLTGTVVAGAAQNMPMMLVGRSIQGIGGGGIIALTNVILTDLVPLRYRGNWVGILGAMWAIGSVTGPVVGGALAHPNVWQWIFWLNVPFIVGSFILVWLFIRLKSIPVPFLTKLQRADWVGSVVFAASLTAILVPLTWGGIMYPWNSWRTISPIGFGITGFIILSYHEKFVAIEPVIRTVVFRNRTTNIAYATTAMHGMTLWCLLYYQPLYFEGVRGFSPIISGVALFPATFTVAPMAIISGIVITKFGKYRFAVWGGWAITTLGCAFLCAVDTNTQLVQVLLTDLVAGIGLGGLFPALQFQLQAASDGRHMATGVAMFAFFRGLGQTLGISVGGTIFQNELSSKLSKQPIFADRAHELAKDATGLVEWMKNAPDGEPLKVMRAAYTDSLRTVYIAIAAVSFVAMVLSIFIKHYDLDRPLETDQYLVENAGGSGWNKTHEKSHGMFARVSEMPATVVNRAKSSATAQHHKRRNVNSQVRRPPPLERIATQTTPGSDATPADANRTPTTVARRDEEPLRHQDQSTEEETEVPREARLLRDAQGKLVFIGDCAPLSFYQSVRQLVITRVDPSAFANQTSQLSVLENIGKTTSQGRNGMPPYVYTPLVLQSVEQYLNATASLVDLFDRDTLVEEFAKWAAGSQRRGPVSIVNYLILAIGAQETDSSLSQVFFEYAREQTLTSLSGDPGLSTVQASILITLYMLRSSQMNGAFVFFGLGVRIAYSIGVHRTEVNARFGLEMGSQRDKLWKSMRIVDLYLSTLMGRPPATSDVDCTVAYRKFDDAGNEVFDMLNASAQVMLIMEAVVVEVYSRRKISLAVTEGISAQLRQWSHRWLPHVKALLDPTTQDTATVVGACQVLASYYYAVMLASRPFLVYELCLRLSPERASDQTNRSPAATGRSKLADACIDAANLMVDVTADLINNNFLTYRMPLLVSWLFASSLVVGLGVMGGFGRLEKRANQSVEALEHFAANDVHAMQYSQIARSLLSTAVQYLDRKEANERLERTASSHHIFGLMPKDGQQATPYGIRARDSSGDGASRSQQTSRPDPSLTAFQDLPIPTSNGEDTPSRDFFETWSQMPDFSMFDGLMDGTQEWTEQDWSALNLFPLLDDGGQIDLS
ncbi:putative MFS transporter [Hortaea werneckii]|nr:putative MFS transporter [Hortaea werneckii]KAI7310667.1 putative MFS transporter [Hortaea werneckii]